MTKHFCAALAGALVFAAAAGAQAEDARMRVKVSDINVTTEDGARTALARIRSGAAEFCDASAGRQGLERTAIVNRCVAEMTRKGVEGLHAPLVTALLDRQAVSQTRIAAR